MKVIAVADTVSDELATCLVASTRLAVVAARMRNRRQPESDEKASFGRRE